MGVSEKPVLYPLSYGRVPSILSPELVKPPIALRFFLMKICA